MLTRLSCYRQPRRGPSQEGIPPAAVVSSVQGRCTQARHVSHNPPPQGCQPSRGLHRRSAAGACQRSQLLQRCPRPLLHRHAVVVLQAAGQGRSGSMQMIRGQNRGLQGRAGGGQGGQSGVQHTPPTLLHKPPSQPHTCAAGLPPQASAAAAPALPSPQHPLHGCRQSWAAQQGELAAFGKGAQSCRGKSQRAHHMPCNHAPSTP